MDTCKGRKGNWRSPPGRPRIVYMAQRSSGGCQRSTTIYSVEIRDRQGSRSGATVTRSLGLREDDDDDDDDLCQKWRVKLIFQGTYRLSGTGIVECLQARELKISWGQGNRRRRRRDRDAKGVEAEAPRSRREGVEGARYGEGFPGSPFPSD